ncbi:hypothetical protein H9P43_004094 [Blastocladiella emersonii ATCC 22665]|nr:hypothetical protein H9P43_004094 [Blastocladiella emersonii ATCC 22665]
MSAATTSTLAHRDLDRSRPTSASSSLLETNPPVYDCAAILHRRHGRSLVRARPYGVAWPPRPRSHSTASASAKSGSRSRSRSRSRSPRASSFRPLHRPISASRLSAMLATPPPAVDSAALVVDEDPMAIFHEPTTATAAAAVDQESVLSSAPPSPDLSSSSSGLHRAPAPPPPSLALNSPPAGHGDADDAALFDLFDYLPTGLVPSVDYSVAAAPTPAPAPPAPASDGHYRRRLVPSSAAPTAAASTRVYLDDDPDLPGLESDESSDDDDEEEFRLTDADIEDDSDDDEDYDHAASSSFSSKRRGGGRKDTTRRPRARRTACTAAADLALELDLSSSSSAAPPPPPPAAPARARAPRSRRRRSSGQGTDGGASSTDDPESGSASAAHTSSLERSSGSQQESSAETQAAATAAAAAAELARDLEPGMVAVRLQWRLDFATGLGAVLEGWTPEEQARTKRRIVCLFPDRRRGEGRIAVRWTVVAAADFDHAANAAGDLVTLSCIYWERMDDFYVTSVDFILAMERLLGVVFKVEEKNRIRRNMETFRPVTVTKARADSSDFFRTVMQFGDPKPRNIEKDIKVFKWSVLQDAMDKILHKWNLRCTEVIAVPAESAAAMTAAAAPAPAPPAAAAPARRVRPSRRRERAEVEAETDDGAPPRDDPLLLLDMGSTTTDETHDADPTTAMAVDPVIPHDDPRPASPDAESAWSELASHAHAHAAPAQAPNEDPYGLVMSEEARIFNMVPEWAGVSLMDHGISSSQPSSGISTPCRPGSAAFMLPRAASPLPSSSSYGAGGSHVSLFHSSSSSVAAAAAHAFPTPAHDLSQQQHVDMDVETPEWAQVVVPPGLAAPDTTAAAAASYQQLLQAASASVHGPHLTPAMASRGRATHVRGDSGMYMVSDMDISAALAAQLDHEHQQQQQAAMTAAAAAAAASVDASSGLAYARSWSLQDLALPPPPTPTVNVFAPPAVGRTRYHSGSASASSFSAMAAAAAAAAANAGNSLRSRSLTYPAFGVDHFAAYDLLALGGNAAVQAYLDSQAQSQQQVDYASAAAGYALAAAPMSPPAGLGYGGEPVVVDPAPAAPVSISDDLLAELAAAAIAAAHGDPLPLPMEVPDWAASHPMFDAVSATAAAAAAATVASLAASVPSDASQGSLLNEVTAAMYPPSRPSDGDVVMAEAGVGDADALAALFPNGLESFTGRGGCGGDGDGL